MKEAPISIGLTSTGGHYKFPTDDPAALENALPNTVLGTIIARDPDAEAKLTFQLDDSAGGRFKLDSSPAKCSAVKGVPVSNASISQVIFLKFIKNDH